MEDSEGGWVPAKAWPIERLAYGEPRSCYVLLPFPETGEVAGLLTGKLVF